MKKRGEIEEKFSEIPSESMNPSVRKFPVCGDDKAAKNESRKEKEGLLEEERRKKIRQRRVVASRMLIRYGGA